ncbi:MAG: type I pullulanase [Candidatus Planktophila sp.]|nr:type I pullulanase [Candidatus Planktophila sp.]
MRIQPGIRTPRTALVGLLITVLAAIVMPTISSAAAPDVVKLVVHYQRPAADYAGWNLWLWKNSSNNALDKSIDPKGVQFNGDDSFGKVLTLEIPDMKGFDDIGIIVRLNDWAQKDVDADRFISVFDANGKAEVWLRKGDTQIHYSLPTEAVKENPAIAQAKIYDSLEFSKKYTYKGDDLGNTYSKSKTAFRVWAPTATEVSLVTYASAESNASTGILTAMTSDVNGTWTASLSGDKNGLIYNYRVTVDGVLREAVDPYVRATTVNGLRGVVVDLSKTDPKGWSTKKPKFSGKPSDAVVYELHVRDLSIDESSGVKAVNAGKYLAFTETKTSKSGVSTAVTSIKELGVTHVELLPIFDFASIDEKNPSFNWGYDPQNYNVPEGSYSSDPTKPTVRITELKSAIQALHNQGLRVNMDVVYNHVFDVNSFSQNQIVPGYFFRTDSNGALTNGSGIGNDVASERSMVSKFIVDSVKYWADEYNLDGFRFDLMGLMDIDTVSAISAALKKIDKSIIIIAEGWNMGALPEKDRAGQMNIDLLPGVSMFNDQLRDGIKGSVFDRLDRGFATGNPASINSVMAGITGNTAYSNTITTKWTTIAPGQSVNYVESHDNLTLADKISGSVPNSTPAQVAQMSRFASSIALLAQGLPFIQAGQEFLRSKNGDENSYKSSDAVNSLKWSTKATNIATYKYFKGLIALRKAHPAFRMRTEAQVIKNLKFYSVPNSVIMYSLAGKAVGDKTANFVVIHNSNATAQEIKLPKAGKWSVVVAGDKAGTKVISSGRMARINVAGQSTTVLQQ